MICRPLIAGQVWPLMRFAAGRVMADGWTVLIAGELGLDRQLAISDDGKVLERSNR